MINNFDIDIDLNELWAQVRTFFDVLSDINIEWASPGSNNTHSVSLLSFLLGSWIAVELMGVFFYFTNKNNSGDD